MKIKLVAAGVLAGGIAVTGLTGSAYAAGDASAPGKAAGTARVVAGSVKDHGAFAIACVGNTVRIQGRPGKATFSSKAPALSKVQLLRVKGKPGVVKIGQGPKGLRCFRVKPGPPPPVPAR